MNILYKTRPSCIQYVAGIAGLAAFVFFTGCSRSGPLGANNDAEAKIPVRLAPVRIGNIRQELMYAANIKALDEAFIYSRVPGKIIKKCIEEGAVIRKGETIALVDRDEVGLTYEPAPVESSLSGLVGRIYVDLGTAVTPQTPVALVVNMEQVRAKVDIPEKYLSLLNTRLSAELSVDAWPDLVFTGIVSKISPVVDQDTRTVPIEIIIENSDVRLNPGMFARVRVILNENKEAIMVPRESVMGRGEDTTVYVVRDKIAGLRTIKTGIRRGSEIEVLEGLSEGDMVVVMGQQRLRDGATVLLEENGAR